MTPEVWAQVAAALRETRGVDLAQRVTQESGLGTRRDEKRAVRRIRGTLEGERPEDLLDPLELPLLEKAAQEFDVGLPGPCAREARDVQRGDAL